MQVCGSLGISIKKHETLIQESSQVLPHLLGWGSVECALNWEDSICLGGDISLMLVLTIAKFLGENGELDEWLAVFKGAHIISFCLGRHFFAPS